MPVSQDATETPTAPAPTKPAEAPSATATARPAVEKDDRRVPVGPVLVAIGLMVVIAELIIIRLLPLPLAIAANVVLALIIATLVWLWRRRKGKGKPGARSARRQGRPQQSASRSGGLADRLAAVRGRVAGAAGRARGGPGRTAGGPGRSSGGPKGRMAALRSKLPKALGGTGRTGGGPGRSTGRTSSGPGRTSGRAKGGAGRGGAPSGSKPGRRSGGLGGRIAKAMSRPKSSGPGSKSASGSGSGKKAGGGFRIPNPFRGRGRSGGSSGSRPSSKPSPKPSGSGTRPGGPKPTGPGHRPGKFIKDVVAGIRSKTNPTKANASKPTQQKNPGKPGVPNGGKKVDTSGPSNVTDTGGGWRPGRQKNQNQPIGGHKPPHRPSHTNTTGGSTMGHGGAAFGFQDKSLIGFGESLKQVPDEIDEMRIKYEAMATAAEEEQPIGNGVSEGLREMARLLAMAGQIGQELHPTYRNQNEADIERYENPRKGSHSVEGRADVQSAQRDV